MLCRTSGRGYRSATGAQAWASAQLASAAKSAPLGLFSKCATVEMGGGGELAPYYPIDNKRGFTGQQTHQQGSRVHFQKQQTGSNWNLAAVGD